MNQLTEFRRELGLTQYELSDLAAVSRHKLQLVEQGISLLTEQESYRIGKILGFKEKPKWLTALEGQAEQ